MEGTREMNANELADKLQELDSKLHLIELFKSATMLRQQQAEIEALKETRCVACGWNPNLIRGERNDSGFYMSDAEHYKLKCERQQAEIEALKKELKRYAEAINHASTALQDEIDLARRILKKASEK